MLDSQLPHVAVSRRCDARGVRKRQRRPVLNEQLHDPADADLFVILKASEPASELVGALNVPRHSLDYAS